MVEKCTVVFYSIVVGSVSLSFFQLFNLIFLFTRSLACGTVQDTSSLQLASILVFYERVVWCLVYKAWLLANMRALQREKEESFIQHLQDDTITTTSCWSGLVVLFLCSSLYVCLIEQKCIVQSPILLFRISSSNYHCILVAYVHLLINSLFQTYSSLS